MALLGAIAVVVMLLPPLASDAQGGATLAFGSTLAGTEISRRRHARTAVPIALLRLGISVAWSMWRAGA